MKGIPCGTCPGRAGQWWRLLLLLYNCGAAQTENQKKQVHHGDTPVFRDKAKEGLIQSLGWLDEDIIRPDSGQIPQES
jgi:hypothetical protein